MRVPARTFAFGVMEWVYCAAARDGVVLRLGLEHVLVDTHRLEALRGDAGIVLERHPDGLFEA